MAKVPIMQIWDDATQQYVAIPSIQGAKGDPGFSPTVSISAIPDGHRVTITEEAGSQSFDVMDGATGPQGPQGEKGPQGEQGPAGQDGASYTVKGLYATLSALQSAHPTGSAGDAWFVGTSEDNRVYQWDVDQAAWVNVGALKGPKGDTGAAGADGKSAYASAQDGGYTGTEAQFNTDLAAVGGKQAKITAGGILKGDGAGGVSAAVKGTDYAEPSVGVTATLSASGWDADAKTQTVSVAGVTATANCIITAAPNSYMAYAEAGVRCTAQGAGTLTFACETVPTADVAANVLILG